MQKTNLSQIIAVAENLTCHAIDQVNQKWEYLCGALQGVKETVARIPERIERESAEERFGKLCIELEKLEIAKRRMDERFSDLLGGELLLTDATMKLMGVEGELTLTRGEEGVADTLEKICALRIRVEEYARMHTQKRAQLEQLIRRTLPHFLDEVYRVSDCERNGKGFRMQSLAALCGGLCNEIKIP